MTRNINMIKSSRYLRKEDADPEITVTIREVAEENVSMEGTPDEFKFVAYFEGHEKGVVLNWTNAQLAAKAVGTSDMDQWPGKSITLYHDPNVSYAGKLIGGIRVKAAQQAQTPVEPNF